MRPENKVLIGVLLIISVTVILMYILKSNERSGASIQEIEQHQKDISAVDKHYGLIRQGDELLRDGDYKNAEARYNDALSMAKNPDGEIVARGKLARIYEQIGEYEKALEQVEWFLNRNLASPGRKRYEESKKRVLQKIQDKRNVTT